MSTEIKSNKMSKLFYKMCFKTKQYSPEILIISGIVSGIVGCVLACRETTKASKIKEEYDASMEAITEVASDESKKDEYSDQDHLKDLVIVHVNTAFKYLKLYAPAILFSSASIVAILASHGIIRKRNMALVAAYGTISDSFAKYRENVVEKYGEEVDNELRYGIKAEKIEEKVTDPETGKTKKQKKTVKVADPNLAGSDYACYFDERSYAYEGVNDYTYSFLKNQQSYANNLLKARGFLFLNEVYDILDIEQTAQGAVTGWVDKPDDPNCDDHVDFRVKEVLRKNKDGELEPAIVLDFNVDGVILDYLPEK